jgi:transitional endoplasmic reticulum ATPase
VPGKPYFSGLNAYFAAVLSKLTEIRQLRDALRLSPDNIPLRKLLADMLLANGDVAEAEETYREAIRQSPKDHALKLALARAFVQNNKLKPALVVLDELIQDGTGDGDVYLLAARLHLRQNESATAVDLYYQAVELGAYDAELEELLMEQPDEFSGVFNPDTTQPQRVRATPDPTDRLPIEGLLERPALRFADVGGMEQVKEEIALKIILPLQQPELFRSYGKKVGGGVLIYGAPGCGKTYLARATAGEINASFIAVGLNDILDMWLGNSERNLHDIFQQARENAPCVLFFDEVDALGASRADLRHSGHKTVINQFLDELDGVRYSNEGVLILAATNTPWHLDSAFRRPGRFDRLLFVLPPDTAARAEIFRLHLANRPIDRIDYKNVAERTDAFSGADIAAVVDRAVERKLLDAMKTGKPLPLTTNDLREAIKQHRPTVREWFASAKNYALYANEGGQYEPILSYMKSQRWL